MAAGVATMGVFPAVPVLLAGAAAVGLSAGPASALLGFFAFDRVSDERRGSAMGTLNALYLVVAPVGTFMGSALLSALDLKGTGIALTAAWIVVTVAALVAPACATWETRAARAWYNRGVARPFRARSVSR